MTESVGSAVVLDTMVVSSLVHAARSPAEADYRSLIGQRPVVVSFVTVTELRYGAAKAGWGELRRRGLERDLARFVVVQPDDHLMRICADLRVRCERIGHALGTEDPRGGSVDRVHGHRPRYPSRHRRRHLQRRCRADRAVTARLSQEASEILAE